ncbi:MAG: serine/threonine protein phosphatase [Zetaproteobacteria bacterium CG12_big_fil_rev_8_21_14_0_65_54_13]|nr:MAG: serine/threonine protein phosphatase [Zetaproteobacteria bacterium CG12_big_fil_rev_8_21_14_0_65_54_13]PIX55689.1 MAG: serine/threonine protein phosphatase [Zetaproteobacteria bacterium CG_4_10_14_3_um_filter_54_28]PJA29354.1 MAG: serine/threonine protein phosphatase [Zetaproteobacteria bacterium CG_4_9_14_3_um_filter_54_145]
MSLQLLHISDSHLYSDATALLKGICPHDSFAAVLADAYHRFPAADAIMLGGDMAQDEQAETYRMLAAMLPDWQAPVMITPGNHASLDYLSGSLIPALAARFGYCDQLQGEHWQIIALNSHQPGHVPGRLAASELTRLEHLLSTSVSTHILIALHHHARPIGSRWLDAIGLINSDALWAIIDRYPQVRVVLCGHIHQPFDSVHKGVRVLGTPSTCVQFTPGTDKFALAGISPGYRWLELLDDGEIRTGINRITGFIPPDLLNNEPY